MKYNILKFITNTAGQYSATVSATFDDLDKAKVNYHTTLATLHNAPDVRYASVKIVTEYGYDEPGFFEEVYHTATETIEEVSDAE